MPTIVNYSGSFEYNSLPAITRPLISSMKSAIDRQSRCSRRTVGAHGCEPLAAPAVLSVRHMIYALNKYIINIL